MSFTIQAETSDFSVCQSDRERLRVLQVVSWFGTGGAEHSISKLVRGLDRVRFEQRICTVRGFDPGLPWIRNVSDDIFVAGQRVNSFQFDFPRLVKIFKSWRPHIVHSRNWGTVEAIAAARYAAVPVVIHSEHGYEMDMLEHLPLRRRLARFFLYGMADAICTVSDELRRYHAREAWCNPKRLRLLHNGVDTETFAPDAELGAELRRSMGIAEDAFVVGNVGRMVAIKDVVTLLRASELVARKYPNLVLVLVGCGPELARYRRFVSESHALQGRVHFAGESREVASLLKLMDILVLASLKEGTSNTILEAMATELPVIATRVGGNPELIVEGDCGMLFEPGNITQLAERMEYLLDNRDYARRLGAAARQRIISHFSLGRMISEYTDLYLEMACRRGVLKNQERRCVWN